MSEETTPSNDTTTPNAAVTDPTPQEEHALAADDAGAAAFDEAHGDVLAAEVAVAAEETPAGEPAAEEPVDLGTYLQRQLDQQIAEAHAEALARAEVIAIVAAR